MLFALTTLCMIISVSRITSMMAGFAGIIAALALYRTTDSIASGISASTACKLTTGVQPPWLPPEEIEETGKLLPKSITVTEPSSTDNIDSIDSTLPITSSSPTLIENVTILIKNKPVMLLFGKICMICMSRVNQK